MSDFCKSCHSCGFPMEKQEDFSQSNVHSLFCRYCTDDEGKLLPFEKILGGTVHHLIEFQGIAEDAAHKMALDLLSTMPAWQSRFTGAEK